MFDKGRVLLDRAAAARRRAAAAVAEELRLLAEFATLNKSESKPAHTAVAAALRMSKPCAHARLELAEALTTRLPVTFTALRLGTIDEYRARRMAEATKLLTDEQVSEVERSLIPHAHEWTPQQLNDRLRRMVAQVAPVAVATRAAPRAPTRAEASQPVRQVTHTTLVGGTGLLQIQGEVRRTQLAHLGLVASARRLKIAGDERPIDQITADVALDRLAGKSSEQTKNHLWLTMPAATALDWMRSRGIWRGAHGTPRTDWWSRSHAKTKPDNGLPATSLPTASSADATTTVGHLQPPASNSRRRTRPASPRDAAA